MIIDQPSSSSPAPDQKSGESSSQSRGPDTLADMKARQAAKMREFRDVLARFGIVTLDAQAKTLGLSRSTAWTILRGNHKSSGMSAAIINRMLATSALPAPVRDKILEYVDEKMSGRYGDSKKKRHRFANKLSIDCESVSRRSSAGRNLSRSPKCAAS